MYSRILITGSSGFIGCALALVLLKEGYHVIGIDDHNDYYNPLIKEARLAILERNKNYLHLKLDICKKADILEVFKKYNPRKIVHLAAQAGVSYSIDNPHVYANTNILGMLNILEACRHFNVEHLLYASSSSVYGMNDKVPFSTKDPVDHPLSFYAATKRAGELMAHSYSHLYRLPVTGLRFFTVYGPWGRPDMAPWKFANAIMNNQNLIVYNKGEMWRDFTYIDDVVESIKLLLDKIPVPQSDILSPSQSLAPFSIYNIGYGQPVKLMDFISILGSTLNKKSIYYDFRDAPMSDVNKTWCDIEPLAAVTGFRPKVSIEEGVILFSDWFLKYHNKF